MFLITFYQTIMSPQKPNPITYAFAAFLLLPFAVLTVLLVAILLCYFAALLCFAWPLLPFVAYASARKIRKCYGKTEVPQNGEGYPMPDPMNAGSPRPDGFPA